MNTAASPPQPGPRPGSRPWPADGPDHRQVPPEYADRSVLHLVPALLEGSCAPRWLDATVLSARQVVLLVLDGLGWQQLQRRLGSQGSRGSRGSTGSRPPPVEGEDGSGGGEGGEGADAGCDRCRGFDIGGRAGGEATEAERQAASRRNARVVELEQALARCKASLEAARADTEAARAYSVELEMGLANSKLGLAQAREREDDADMRAMHAEKLRAGVARERDQLKILLDVREQEYSASLAAAVAKMGALPGESRTKKAASSRSSRWW